MKMESKMSLKTKHERKVVLEASSTLHVLDDDR